MQGTLFRYGSGPAQIAFCSSSSSGSSGAAGAAPAPAPPLRRHLVLVAGLTEGLLALPYAPALAAAAARAGYALVQAQLTSSYGGWGVGSLDADADDLLALSRCLRSQHGCEGLVLMGHSTGTQDAVRFCERHGGAGADVAGAAPLEGVILQAPVSDREWLAAFQPALCALLPDAERLVAAGKGDDIVARAPADLGGAPLSAARLVALAARLGDDDIWSTDLTDTELNARLGHLAPRPVLLLQSGADECAPDAAAIPALGRRALAAMAGESGGGSGGGGGAVGSGGGGQQAALKRHVVIDGAPHNAAGHEDAVARHVGEFLEAIAASSRR